MRGNAAQASYIWNKMSARDRASFSRGEGVEPEVDEGTITSQMIQHQADEGGQDSEDEAPATVKIPGEELPR